MKSLTCLLAGAIFLATRSSSQAILYSTVSPGLELGAYSTAQQDAFSFTGNTAALARTVHSELGIYGERRYGLSAISFYSLAAVFPSRAGNFGLQFSYGGFALYNEYSAGLAYARSLGPGIDLGIRFNGLGVRIPAYVQSLALNFEGGLILHCSEKVLAGFHLYDPIKGFSGKSGSGVRVPRFSMGLGFDASPDFFAGCEFEKEEDRPVNVTAGFRYRFSEVVFLRAGIAGVSGTAYAGAGVQWGNLRLFVSASYHPRLGITPGILFFSGFKKNEL
jgi:hypothetical protein